MLQSEIISKYLKEFPEGTEFAISIITSNETSFHGVRLLANSVEKLVNNKSYFEIGSISKLFTATVLVNVLSKHGISIDDEINAFLDVRLKNDEGISFKSLVNHTSGLPADYENLEFDENSENPFMGIKEKFFLNYIENRLKINRKIKGSFSYSNVGVALLGYTLSQMEKRSWSELVDDYVFSRYNMPTSTYNRDLLDGKVVQGQNRLGDKVSHWEFGEMNAPADGVLSNVEELSNFVLANFLEDEFLKKIRQITYKGDQHFDVAINWFVHKNGNYYFHGGATRGYRSMLILDEKNKNGVVVLSNVSCYHENSLMIRELGVDLLSSI